MLAGRDNAVVASPAGSKYLCVIHSEGRRKYTCRMAVLANVRSLNMRWRFARCASAVVACRTAAHNVGVIKVRGNPAVCCMAIVTVIAACNVHCMFAACGNAVMAGATGADDLRVVDRCGGREHGGVVAVLANIRCLDVRRIFPNGA